MLVSSTCAEVLKSVSDFVKPLPNHFALLKSKPFCQRVISLGLQIDESCIILKAHDCWLYKEQLKNKVNNMSGLIFNTLIYWYGYVESNLLTRQPLDN